SSFPPDGGFPAPPREKQRRGVSPGFWVFYSPRRGQDEQDSHGRSPGLWTGDAAIEFTRWRIHILWLPAGGCSGFAWVDEPSRWWRARNPFFSRTHFSAFAQNLPLTLHEAMTGKPKKSAESGSH